MTPSKRLPPPRLDMTFTEALARFAQTDPAELRSQPPAGSEKPSKGKRRMSREPRPFVFTLTDEEAAEIVEAVGSGGQQSLHRRLTADLEKGREVTFDDAQLGELIRYMTQYGSGGFQGRLRKAFIRSLYELLALEGKF